MNWCILIPLIVGLLSALFGYLLGKLLAGGSNDKDSAAINMWRDKNSELEDALAACKSKLSASQSSNSFASGTATVKDKVDPISESNSLTGSDTSSEGNTSGITSSFAGAGAIGADFDAVAAKAAFGKRIIEDDLTVVEGIGPKIQELFKENGVTTWGILASTAVSRLQEILNSKGERYRVHNPGTWPDQARMAFEGKWAELKKWQDEHDYGKA